MMNDRARTPGPCLIHASAVALLLTTAAVAFQQRPDRSRPPEPGPPPALHLPDIHRRALSNGLPVWIVEQHEVPLVEVQLVVRAGSAADPPSQFGLASLAATMLDEGAGARGALEIADAVEYLGADLSTGSSFDASTVRLHVPVARLEEALKVMADVVLRPTFPSSELERLREERLTSLLQARDDPAAIASQAFNQIVYGAKHRYGAPEIGTPAALRRFAADDLRSFHERYYRPDRAALILAGDVTSDRVLPLLESPFGPWATGELQPQAKLPDATQLKQRRVDIIDKPDAAQSEIRIGWIGVPRSTPDYFVLQVLNTILGGTFTSRLNQNLREQHGYAYGAGSAFVMRQSAGPFYAAAAVQTDKTAEALVEFFRELDRIREPVPADEMTKAKTFLSLRFPLQFETTRQIAGRLADLFIYELSEQHFEEYVTRIEAVTADEVQKAARQYIQPENMAVVIAGDRRAIEDSVRALNLGPVTVLSVSDVMGPAQIEK